MKFLAVVAALILLGALWRFALRGAAVAGTAILIGGAALVVGVYLWDRAIVEPRQSAARAEECAQFQRRHPDVKPAPSGATSLTFDQATDPCPAN